VTIAPGKIGLVRTGLVIEAPAGHFLMLTARSSLALKKGLTLSNGVGTIDRDYAGPTDEIFLQLLNIGESECIVEKGDRLVNGIFLSVEQFEWIEQETIRTEDRGGHGSTGGYAV
jgi:dUTP pyrophosphatase